MDQPLIIETAVKNIETNKPSHSIEFNIDCWEYVFDNLSLRDILVMSQTCQQMCEIGGHYFRKHFYSISCDIINNEDFLIRWFQFKQTDFLRFIDTLNIYGQLYDHLNPFPNGSLTKLNLCFIDLNGSQIYGLENILNNIESVQLYSCAIFDGFFEQFFKYCPKLKCLSLNRVVFKSDTVSNGLFQQRCRTLQYFQYLGTNQMSHKNGALNTFLTQNSNIKYLEIDAEELWLQRYLLFGLNTQLDCLAIKIRLDGISAIPFANLLKTLHKHGFYKKFHLTVVSLPNNFEYQEFVDQMITFAAFEQLYTVQCASLSCLTQLKELYISGNRFAKDMETLAINLTQLKRLHICGARIEFILPFLRHTKTLKTILMISDLDNALNVFALNQEREKLELAQKVLIGVCENVYLATKRKFVQLNWQFVQIVREESIDFDHINKYLQ